MLKAHSRVFEQLMLASDLVLVAGCWLLAYGLRVYVVGPPITGGGVPPLEPYLLMLLPILIVWGVSFRTFDLYRPRRIGSHLSEAADIAKASTVGALVLVAIMTFVFRGYDYSRVVIVYFWLLSIAVVWFSRAAFREVLRFARRRGYNLRYAVVVGDGASVRAVLERFQSRPDVGIKVLGVVGDDKDSSLGVPWLGGYADLRAVLDAREVDHVMLALAHGINRYSVQTRERTWKQLDGLFEDASIDPGLQLVELALDRLADVLRVRVADHAQARSS